MNFTIYVLEESLNRNYLKIIKEYEKRLGAYCKLRLFVVKNKKDIKEISKYSHVILVNKTGSDISSVGLSEKIRGLALNGKSQVLVIIGDVWDEVKNAENIRISQMDLSIGLQAVIFYEQIYRVYRIIKGEPYHK